MAVDLVPIDTDAIQGDRLKIHLVRSADELRLALETETTTSGYGLSLQIYSLGDLKSPSMGDPDREWFYSDPNRVVQYAGKHVAILNKTVIASGSEEEAVMAANDALVLRVPTEEERSVNTIGL